VKPPGPEPECNVGGRPRKEGQIEVEEIGCRIPEEIDSLIRSNAGTLRSDSDLNHVETPVIAEGQSRC